MRITNLRRARIERGLKQKELSRRARIRQPLLSEFESGKLIPGPEMRTRLARALKLPEGWLFFQD